MATKTTPIKTGDVVVDAKGVKYFVRHIQLTGDGALLHLMPIEQTVKAVHYSEVRLDRDIVGDSEIKWRSKSAGIREKADVTLPSGMSSEKAQKILNMYSNQVREK